MKAHQYHFEFWTRNSRDAQRVTVKAHLYEVARQIVIGRYAPTFLRPIFQKA